jgi:hypothetical protein
MNNMLATISCNGFRCGASRSRPETKLAMAILLRPPIGEVDVRRSAYEALALQTTEKEIKYCHVAVGVNSLPECEHFC